MSQRNDTMRCPCGGLLRITNTYRGTSSSRASSATCASCQKRATIVCFVSQSAPAAGQGAAAVARALAAGELNPALMPKVVDAPPA